jgi:hypothetical protein
MIYDLLYYMCVAGFSCLTELRDRSDIMNMHLPVNFSRNNTLKTDIIS